MAWKRKKLAGAVLCLALACANVSYGETSKWVEREDGWYYYLEENVPGSGWIEDKEISYYLVEGGRCLTNQLTPDGYYVDENGGWYKRKTSILGVTFTAPDRFAPLGAEWEKKTALLNLAETITQAFDESRRVRVAKDRIEYTITSKDDSQGSETVLAGLYQDPQEGRYCLELRLKIYPGSTDEKKAATYDYGFFQALLYQISSSPEVLEAAILDAWQGSNQWKIGREEWVQAGDAMIQYVPGKGFGRFLICPAGEGN